MASLLHTLLLPNRHQNEPIDRNIEPARHLRRSTPRTHDLRHARARVNSCWRGNNGLQRAQQSHCDDALTCVDNMPPLQDQAGDAICLSRAKIPALIHSSRRSRIVVAEQAQSAIASCEQPNRRTWTSFSKMIRSGIRCRWHPSGCEGAYTGRGGSSAANWSHSGSSSHHGLRRIWSGEPARTQYPRIAAPSGHKIPHGQPASCAGRTGKAGRPRGALGLVCNAVVLRDTRYIGAAVARYAPLAARSPAKKLIGWPRSAWAPQPARLLRRCPAQRAPAASGAA